MVDQSLPGSTCGRRNPGLFPLTGLWDCSRRRRTRWRSTAQWMGFGNNQQSPHQRVADWCLIVKAAGSTIQGLPFKEDLQLGAAGSPSPASCGIQQHNVWLEASNSQTPFHLPLLLGNLLFSRSTQQNPHRLVVVHYKDSEWSFVLQVQKRSPDIADAYLQSRLTLSDSAAAAVVSNAPSTVPARPVASTLYKS